MTSVDLSRAIWRKSRRSNNGGNCVEVAALPHDIAVRDSKDPGAGHLAFTMDIWAAFVAEVRDGWFDLP